MSEKWRQEHKFIISESDRIILSSRLSAVFKKDIHSNNNGTYQIRSLYFDDMDNTAFREKLDGNPVRKKYRIRYYNYDTSFIRLEKKVKNMGGCMKDTAALTLAETEKIIDGDYDFLIESESPLLREFYTSIKLGFIKPSSIVDYNREAFCAPYGNIRITLDSNIKSSSFTDAFFDENLALIPSFSDNQSVLEVKFDDFLPDYIKQLLAPEISGIFGSMSKYAASRQYM